ncbi:50S ribosomal protein L6 [Candidatus Poribacteria bacterium]|nr:50S ribosomal protein L6 [Candidatus Poribacteria bacterium]
MSRIGRMPIPVPKGVKIAIDADRVRVEGPKGKLERTLPPYVRVVDNGDHVAVERVGESKRHRAMHGLVRSLIANMVTGVSDGFAKNLRVVGTGYRAQVQGKALQLVVGFSHAVQFPIPDGITVTVGAPETVREGSSGVQHLPVTVAGIDKELVGETAAAIRRVKPPDHYEPSKGIRYAGERVRLMPKKARA